jgi:hypothetical protein
VREKRRKEGSRESVFFLKRPRILPPSSDKKAKDGEEGRKKGYAIHVNRNRSHYYH